MNSAQHAAFAAALWNPAAALPEGLVTWNGSDPARRFDVYRNNVTVSLVDALADAFPVVQALVGEAFFRAMARAFVHAAPPRGPVLACYGAGFATFVTDFTPAASLPWLADMARLEWARQQAAHAADATPLAAAQLAPWLANPERLPALRLRAHPAVTVLYSDHAVVSLWAAHQQDATATAAAVAAVEVAAAEAALIVRPHLEVHVVPLPAVCAQAAMRLVDGEPLAEAAAGLRADELAKLLALLLRAGALASAHDGADRKETA